MRKVTKISENKPVLANTAKLRVAAYCRVSTDHEDQLVSLEAQKQHYILYIQANPQWELVEIYIDEGISGTKKDKRAELLRLLTDCENRKIDFIITKSISRFARNTTDCLEIVRRLTDLGIHVLFEKENINTGTMDGELMLTILSGLAENESISFSQNNNWGIQRRFQNGTFKLSSPPYGYGCIDGKLVINMEQAEVVRRIFREALDGKGSEVIARGLNADGIASSRGVRWRSNAVLWILTNEKYVGDMLLQKTYTDDQFSRHINHGEKDQYLITGSHEPIISREDFEAVAVVQLQRGEEKGVVKGAGKYMNRYPFSSKIRCGECCSTFKRRTHANPGNRYIAWCCSKHINDSGQCSMRFIREDAIQKAFVVMMNKLVFGHSFILKPLVKSLKEQDLTGNIARINELEKRIDENAERGRVLIGLMTKGYLDPALFNTQNNELRMEATKLKEQKEALSHTVNGGLTTLEQAELLLKYVVKAEGAVDSFDEELFDRFVNGIVVYTPTEIGFQLKCGITLREQVERKMVQNEENEDDN